MSELEQSLHSAIYDLAVQKALRDAEDHGRPPPSESELDAIGKRADALNVYGFDAKQDSRGNWIQQGIGAKGRETGNHYASIRRYLGEQAYEKAVREIYKRDPDRARKIGLPEPTRAA